MKRSCRVVGLILAIAASGYWLATGANRGWTRTSVPIATIDEVTGIEGIHYRKQFVPGLDFMGAALLGAGALAGAASLFRKQNQSNKS